MRTATMLRTLHNGGKLASLTSGCCQSKNVMRLYKHCIDISTCSCLQQSRWISRDGGGKSDGYGGSIRRAGGAFGQMQVAHEEKYFRDEQVRQFKEMKMVMKDTLKSKLDLHQAQLAAHLDGIRRHEEYMLRDSSNELHKFHISQHREAVRHEEEEIQKLQETWKKMNLEG